MLRSICQQSWKICQQWPQDCKRLVFIPIPKKGNDKECSDYCTIALISHASKVMLKILQARLQHYLNWELPDVQAWVRKGRGTNICWIIEKAREFQKRCWSWSSDTWTTWWEELTHWERHWCWERLKAKGEEGGREWDGLTQWTWIWANSRG